VRYCPQKKIETRPKIAKNKEKRMLPSILREIGPGKYRNRGPAYSSLIKPQRRKSVSIPAHRNGPDWKRQKERLRLISRTDMGKKLRLGKPEVSQNITFKGARSVKIGEGRGGNRSHFAPARGSLSQRGGKGKFALEEGAAKNLKKKRNRPFGGATGESAAGKVRNRIEKREGLSIIRRALVTGEI